MGWWVTYYAAKLAKQPGQVQCHVLEWSGGGEEGGVGEREGRDMLQHTIHWPAAASCSGMV